MYSPEHEKLVLAAYENLVAQIRKYRLTASLDLVEQAFLLAKEAHKTQFRKASGEPYVIHPIEVATILAEIKSDQESIVAALLHDVVEDCAVTEEDLATQFGSEVSLLVSGVTKMDQVKYVSKTEAMAETYRKMFFHMSEDVRVLLIKIADRLHNLRTLDGMPEEHQVRKAREALDIYAPLAHRLGISMLRYEIEELGFRYSDPTLYNELTSQVRLKMPERIALTERMMADIRNALKDNSIEGIVEGRPKRLYSIYKKMKSKNKVLDEIHDLYAVRILVKGIPECYMALGLVNGLFTPVDGRIKDYIAKKKPNGYQSLHTTLVGPGEHFEVQIRSFEMHEVAEFGVAAHWKYKEGGKAAKDKWLQEIMDLQNEISDSDEFLSALKMDLSAFQGHISVFTPQGEPVNLVDGSCTIDFAYAIHSAVGNRMVGARVNGKLVPIDHELASGDIVEVVTSQNSKGPNPDWLKVVKTNQARSKINQWFNKENREVNLQKGKETLERLALEKDITLDELLAEGREADVLARFNCKSMDNLYIMVATGGIKEKQVTNHLYREYEKVQPPPSTDELIEELLSAKPKTEVKGKKSGIVIKGLGDTSATFSKCCNPLPGDEVLGFVTRGRGMTVHRSDCINVLHMNEIDRRRLMTIQWDVPEKANRTYLVNLRITCPDGNHVIYVVNDVLKDENILTSSFSAASVQGQAVVSIGVNIHDTDHLNHLIKRLQAVTKASEIARVNT